MSPLDDLAALNRLQLLITRRLDGMLHGDYLGLLPGLGSEPGEAREYRAGDDVRRMDWPVTARTTVPHVRTTIADRELEAWLAIDLSASLSFGTANCFKRDLAINATAALAHLVGRGGNRVGAVVSSGEDTKLIQARPGRAGARSLLHAVASLPQPTPADQQERPRWKFFAKPSAPPAPASADLATMIDRTGRCARKRGFAAVISDFLGPDHWHRPLRKLAARQQVLCVEIVDPRDAELPDVGVLDVIDPESGQQVEVQTSDPGLRAAYAAAAQAQRDAVAAAVRRAGASHLRLSTDSDWLRDIVLFVGNQRHARSQGSLRGNTPPTT
ncbi:DUF58 domain-containing protein [Natronoglycomyces albus]|uniref:DUF58 domain-containing protein n=1 Tax=Natronoglycomyces albus TaxID=2811108 RepID=A0A895XWQ2_9ACTN|nr:DUF58 domain-containing protein [Natronoglycomyces albus]QSB06650.1 DUF58 domain-containing protein [Natronoglycomyces albus]